MKSSGLASNLQPSGAKADALREEMEEAANRVEICRVPGPLLAEGGLGAPRLWGELQPLLSPCSASSLSPACAEPSPAPQIQRGGIPAKRDIPSSSVPILCIPLELESLPFPGNPSWQSSALGTSSPGTVKDISPPSLCWVYFLSFSSTEGL